MKSVLTLILATACALAVGTATCAETAPTAVTAVPLLSKPLADLKNQEAVMLTVEYAPGAASPSHRHNANTFVYVLEGSVVMQVKGGREQTLTAGQTFYESPSDIHSVSRNASATQRAKILVFFVKTLGAPSNVPVSDE